jgi:hypothetical protein
VTILQFIACDKERYSELYSEKRFTEPREK